VAEFFLQILLVTAGILLGYNRKGGRAYLHYRYHYVTDG